MTPDYFSAVGVPLLNGRLFTNLDDTETTPVAVISLSLAERHWGDTDPIGQRVTLDQGESWITVVGIAGDTREHTLEGEPTDQLYRPLFQGGNASRILVRTTGDPLAMSRQIRDAVHAVDPDQPVENFQTLDETRAGVIANRRLTMVLLGLFAVLALLITVTGIAAVIATSVSERTREFGLRLALGAERSSVLAMVMRQGLWLIGAGLVLGAAGAVAFGRVLSTFLYETGVTDVATFVAVSLLFLLAGMGACFLPARRAMAVDPMVALRSE